jgi:hypothetical protein
MPRSDRKGEDLVGPEILAGRLSHAQHRCNRDDEQDRPETRADSVHKDVSSMDIERGAR